MALPSRSAPAAFRFLLQLPTRVARFASGDGDGAASPKGTVGTVGPMGVVNPQKSQHSIFQNCEIPRGEI